MEDNWQPARLIPVTGISKGAEAEQRATSATLAVLRVVRPLSKALLSPFGASRADKARVDTYIEPTFKMKSGKTVRPDGLIRVSYGKGEPWTALVEVKTGRDKLGTDQVNAYFDVALQNGYDCVLTISNEIAPSPGVHPTAGLKDRANSRSKIHHLSWSMLLAEALHEKHHRGVTDPEQAWILGELIRYLEHDSSGALSFDDMGANWIAVRDGARDGSLTRRNEGVIEVAQLWDQLLRFTALKLGSDIGDDVEEVIPKKHRDDPKQRNKDFVDRLCESGTLAGTIRVPNTAGDIDVLADLRSRQIVIGAEIMSPDDRGAKARVTWLTRQLKNASPECVVESYAKNSRRPEVGYLSAVIEDPALIVGDAKKPPQKFRVLLRTEMGMARTSGRKPGFVDSVLHGVEHFYSTVLQGVTPFQAKAAKIERPTAPYLETATSPQELAPEKVDSIEVTPIRVQAAPVGWSWDHS